MEILVLWYVVFGIFYVLNIIQLLFFYSRFRATKTIGIFIYPIGVIMGFLWYFESPKEIK
jgi:hypothetical protein